LAAKLYALATPLLIGTIVLFLILGGVGIGLFFKMNEDAMEVMAPVDSIYYQRYLKYKDIFYENSADNYQPQWIMSGLGMYLNVVMFPKSGKGNPIAGTSDEPDLRGVDAMERFFNLVEDYNSTDGKMFPDLCAKHSALRFDKCYRMNMTRAFAEENRGGNYEATVYKRFLQKKNRGKSFFADFPSFKAQIDGLLTVVSLSEILGSTNPKLFEPEDCEKKIGGATGRSVPKFNMSCQNFSDYSERVEALRYGWHLAYDTEEQLTQSYNWVMEVEGQCKEFEVIVNANNTDNDTYWEFMCYHSTTLSDAAKLGITADIKWIVIALLLSLVLPVLMVLKPCGKDNFAMLVLVAVGLFFVTLIGSIGVGSMLGFEFVYSFIVALIFLVWIFMRLAMHMVESLKDYMAIYSQDEGKTRKEAVFSWLCGHWIFPSLSNFTVLSLTSFLVCCAMYKIIWFTSGFFGVFFLLSSVGFLLMFLSAVAVAVKSRTDGDGCCCMGSEEESDSNKPTLDNKLMHIIKKKYHSAIIEAKFVTRLAIVGLFILMAIVCIFYSVVIFSADEGDVDYYGYDRSQMMLPDDNGMYMLDVLNKYYPYNGPLVQVIFNGSAKYHFNGK